LGDLLEGVVLRAFEAKTPFSKETLAEIAELKKIYHLTLKDGYKLREESK
jgi:hypothetical protein